jgi:hypothetical protein
VTDSAFIPKAPTPPTPARTFNYREEVRVQDDGISTHPDLNLSTPFENLHFKRSNDIPFSQVRDDQEGRRYPSPVDFKHRDRSRSRADNSRNASEDSIHYSRGRQRTYNMAPLDPPYSSSYQPNEDPYTHDIPRDRRTYVRDSLDVERPRNAFVASPERYTYEEQNAEFLDKHVTFRESVSAKSPDRVWTPSDFSGNKQEKEESKGDWRTHWGDSSFHENTGWYGAPDTDPPRSDR